MPLGITTCVTLYKVLILNRKLNVCSQFLKPLMFPPGNTARLYPCRLKSCFIRSLLNRPWSDDRFDVLATGSDSPSVYKVQTSAKVFVRGLVKFVPAHASLAGTNFTKPRTKTLADLFTKVIKQQIRIKINKQMKCKHTFIFLIERVSLLGFDHEVAKPFPKVRTTRHWSQ